MKLLLTSFIILSFSLPLAARAGNDIEVKVAKAGSEQYERDVDQVALASQEQAISKLAGLLKKYRGTRQEPILLTRLADLQQQNAAILFRIAHGFAHRGKKLDLTRYNKAMTQSISTLNQLITSYPDYEEMPRAWFMRGKAYEELQDKGAATRNYLHLVKTYPDAEETPSAYMSLAEYAIGDNDHPTAITYLKEVEKLPDNPQYPFALYKLAWSHYNLKNIPASLSYIERHVAYYDARLKNGENSDLALRENSLLDSTVFFMEGYEEGLPQYRLGEALHYFRKLEGGGKVLGRMAVRFAKLLRSHGHETDLVAWKDEILNSEPERPESLEVVMTTYEFQLNKRRYAQLNDTAQDVVRVYKKHPQFEGFDRGRKLLLDTADGLQQLIVKNKGADEVGSLSVVLAAIYDAFTRIVDEADPRIPRVHYNLAETLFTIKDFQGATANYRWVVEHGTWKDPQTLDASLKAIASRYEVFKQKDLLPKDLAARPFSRNSDSKLDPMLAEWVAWIDTHQRRLDEKTKSKQFESFLFEANRALYGMNHILDAVDRLKTFATRNPGSEYAIPSASLVIDTSIASAEWEKTHDLANDFLEVKPWKGTDFSKRLFLVAADAFYKQIELKSKANDFRAVLKGSDEFLKRYASSPRLAECLMLAGNAALVNAEPKRAQAYFSRLISDASGSVENLGPALLARAAIAEDKYRFSAAASDYKMYLSLPADKIKLDPKEGDKLRRKTLALTWLAGELSELRTTLGSKSVCTESLASECEKYTALAAFAQPTPQDIENAFERARKAGSESKSIWAALALDGAKDLAFKDRLLMVKLFASGWDDLEPLVKFTLLPRVSVSVPRAFALDRGAMREVAPLRAEEKYITHRVDWIREMENAAAKVAKLPWMRMRAEVTNEIAGLYLDFSREIAALPQPKGLSGAEVTAYEETIRKITLPFEEKGQDMRAKAFEIASRSRIEEAAFRSIAEPFFAENPSQAKTLRYVAAPRDDHRSPADASSEIGLGFLATLDPAGGWDAMIHGRANLADLAEARDPSFYVRALWVEAIQAHRWQQIAFFMQEAQEKALVQAGVMGAVKALSLAEAGARAEGLEELESSLGDLDPRGRGLAVSSLVKVSLQSCARDRTRDLVKKLPLEGLNAEQSSLLASAKAYIGSK